MLSRSLSAAVLATTVTGTLLLANPFPVQAGGQTSFYGSCYSGGTSTMSWQRVNGGVRTVDMTWTSSATGPQVGQTSVRLTSQKVSGSVTVATPSAVPPGGYVTMNAFDSSGNLLAESSGSCY